MRVDSKYKVELAACDPKDLRTNLEHAHFDAEKGRLSATNGRVLAVVPATNENDHSGPVTTAALQSARKAAGKSGSATIGLIGHQVTAGASFERPQGIQFPAIDQVIPKHGSDDNVVRIGLDANLLLDLAKAIGATRNKQSHVQLTIKIEKGTTVDAILVNHASGHDEAFGVIMPVRV